MKISKRFWQELKRKFDLAIQKGLSFFSLILIGIYRTIGTPVFGGCCRFSPSCSEFAQGCYHRFDFATATRLTLRRILLCRPGGGFGHDPVPEKGSLNESKQQ